MSQLRFQQTTQAHKTHIRTLSNFGHIDLVFDDKKSIYQNK